MLKPAAATSAAISPVKAGSDPQTGEAIACEKVHVPVRAMMSATAARRASPPMKVSNIVRMEAASPA